MIVTRPARTERHALADLMAQLGPGAPTLCAGWTTRDLAAHVIMRDRRYDAAPGILFGPLRPYAERVRTAVAQRPYPELVAEVRQPPWWSWATVPPLDSGINTIEFFVHHEDVRRAQPDWAPRSLPADLEGPLWSRAKGLAKLGLRRFKAEVTLHAPGYGETTVGRGGPPVRVSGPPAELLLFAYGRQRAARVEVSGPDDTVTALRKARLGL